MKIYTKIGDCGLTNTYNNKKISKGSQLIEVIGTIDELQAFIGLVKTKTPEQKTKNILNQINKDLYKIMAILSGAKVKFKSEKRIVFLEKIIDKKSKNKPLNHFLLPGKNEQTAWFHILRTICRRAERDLVRLREKENKKLDNLLPYFNRLSDFFFVFSL